MSLSFGVNLYLDLFFCFVKVSVSLVNVSTFYAGLKSKKREGTQQNGRIVENRCLSGSKSGYGGLTLFPLER